jgi:nucleoside-diphosphate-sugar epimerase
MAAAILIASQLVDLARRKNLMRVLVTGASGFIGRALVNELAARDHRVRAAMRTPADIFPRTVEVVAVSDLARPIEWRPLIRDIDAVVHLAGIAQVRDGVAEEVYDRVNRAATAALAAAATAARTRRLVFVSSVRAQSGPHAPQVLTEADAPAPTDGYGRSKLAAEAAVRAANLPYTILRPTLIYGGGVKGNLARLMRLARTPLPLPFGALRNRRSLLARENLINAIHFVLGAEATVGETYLVADPAALTLAEIIGALRAGAGRRAGLIPIPAALIKAPLMAIGRTDLWERLGGQSIVDPKKLLAAGWRPVIETRAGLAAMVQAAALRSTR